MRNLFSKLAGAALVSAIATVAMLFASCGNTANAEKGAADSAPLGIVEQQAAFPGGTDAMFRYFSDNVRYPEACVADSIEGRVICRMIIHADGSISGVEVIRGAHELLDKEAVRLLSSMPAWQPAMNKGQAVDAWYTVPVTFRLQNGDTAPDGN